MVRQLLSASFVLVVALSLACTGKKETPGVVGNQYPHDTLDVTGSPYQAYAPLQNKQGVLRDTDKVRGPSLEPVKPPDTGTTATQGGVQNTVETGTDTTQGGTTK